MKIGNRIFDTEHDCYIMAILNVTPDSFSDGGKWNDVERAKQHAAQMIAEGAAIIDVGGESTRPGHQQITVQEEIDRVVPVIEMLKQNFDIPVSIDSYKSQVVEAALKAGADLLLMPADFKEAYNGVLDAVKTGELTEERIDQSLTRILGLKLTLPRHKR